MSPHDALMAELEMERWGRPNPYVVKILDALGELHHRSDGGRCDECDRVWPCTTVRLGYSFDPRTPTGRLWLLTDMVTPRRESA